MTPAIKINGVDKSIPALKTIPLDGTSLSVRVGTGEPITYGPSEGGNFVLVLFDGADSRLHQVLLVME